MGSGSLYWTFRFPMFGLLAATPHRQQDLGDPALHLRKCLFRLECHRLNYGAKFRPFGLFCGGLASGTPAFPAGFLFGTLMPWRNRVKRSLILRRPLGWADDV